jgi:hypothetical protein
MSARVFPFAALAFLAALPLRVAAEAPQTVCTVTINSADEREVFQRSLPSDRFRFVELVQPGRSDWLAAACEAKVQCDVLVVSGHFAGTEFYSSRPAVRETLKVDDMRQALCSAACPGVFANLKEVYLFGCDTLKAEPVRSATPEILRHLLAQGTPRTEAEREVRALSERYAESSRDLMRRLFPGVPVIYGFASLAPLGRYAGPMLERYFETGGIQEVGRGQPSARLLGLFGPSSMVATMGQRDDEPLAAEREATCRPYDLRRPEDDRVAAMHAILAGPAEGVRMAFDALERFFAAPPAGTTALQAIRDDSSAAERYVAVTRTTHDPALRLRMVSLARTVGWLDESREREERMLLVRDVVRDPAMDYGEVELVCSLTDPAPWEKALSAVGSLQAMTAPQAAALACLGDAKARERTVRAVASPEEHEVRAAQAYLRHRPIEDPSQLRALARAIAAMKHEPAQVRALETLARHHVDDAATLDELAGLFARARSDAVRRAIAEVYLRSGSAALARAPAGVGTLLRRLSS